ncbi:hypothetical protein D3C72_1017210 [compost metagenome]
MPAHFALHAGRNRTPVRAVVDIDAYHRRHLPAVQAAQLRIVHVVGLEAQRVGRRHGRQAQAIGLVQVHAERAGAGEEALALPGQRRQHQRLVVIVRVGTGRRAEGDAGLDTRALFLRVCQQRRGENDGAQQGAQQGGGQ